MGYNMLIMYSGLKTIPTELYEAAEIDGASRFQEAWYIKIPAIKGQILISFMFSIIGTFQLFNEPNLLKPLASNVITSYYTPNLYAYNLSMNGNQYNYSATVAIAMGVITAIIAYATQARSQKQEGN
ncbi:MAG: carbohydrate ABC transporter permease, partial [Ancrocorticia populi]